jgi:hypothetical protein
MKIFWVIVACFLMPSIVLSSQEQMRKEKEEKISVEQKVLLCLEKAALNTASGVVYLGKGVFYVTSFAASTAAKLTFLTVKTGAGIIINIPISLFKVAFFLSGGYVVLKAVDIATLVVRVAALAGIVAMGYSALSSPEQ